MLNEDQFASIQYMAGKEQYEMDAFSIGQKFAGDVAVGYAVQDNQDLFWKGYVDAHHERMAPVTENA